MIDEYGDPYYTYRNDEGWEFEKPTTEKIEKVFPWEYREFDNCIGCWTNHDVWYFSEEMLQEYIDMWLSWDSAWEYYEDELEKILKKKKTP